MVMSGAEIAAVATARSHGHHEVRRAAVGHGHDRLVGGVDGDVVEGIADFTVRDDRSVDADAHLGQ